MADPTWTRENMPDIIWQADPDGALAVWVDAAENEAMTQSLIVQSIRDMQNVDECDPRFLPYIADAIGLQLNALDPPGVWRAQIRSAISWYKERGKPSAFRSVLHANQIQGTVTPLWINDQNEVIASFDSPGDGWKPHARIDIDIVQYPDNIATLDDPFGYVLRVLEEVRPAHVRLRAKEEIIDLGYDLYPNTLGDADDFDLPTVGIWDVDAPQFVACGEWFTITLYDRKFFQDHPPLPMPTPPIVTQRVVPILTIMFNEENPTGLVGVNAQQNGDPLGPVLVDTGDGIVPLLTTAAGALPTMEVEDPTAMRTALNGIITLRVRLTDCVGGDTFVLFGAVGGGYTGLSDQVMVTEQVCWTITRFDATFNCVTNKWEMTNQTTWESQERPPIVDVWLTDESDVCKRYLIKAQGRPGLCSSSSDA